VGGWWSVARYTKAGGYVDSQEERRGREEKKELLGESPHRTTRDRICPILYER